jgi:hypothetical protein
MKCPSCGSTMAKMLCKHRGAINRGNRTPGVMTRCRITLQFRDPGDFFLTSPPRSVTITS